MLATTFPRWKNDTEPAFVYNLCKELAEKGHAITVLVPHAHGAKVLEEEDGLKIIRFRYFFPARLQRVCYEGGALPNLRASWIARLGLPFFLIAQFISIGWTIFREKTDLIHCHWIIPQGFFAAIWSRLLRIPLIITAHGGDVFPLRNPVLLFFARHALSTCDLCTVNSRSTREALNAIIPLEDVPIIPMGIDVEKFNPAYDDPDIRKNLDDPQFLLLTVGRFAEKKGFEYLIKAMPAVMEKFSNTKLLIIGFGPLESDLKNLVKSHSLEDVVLFPGKMNSDELKKYYATADLFIGPSIVDEGGDTEGLGVVFLEALSSGTAAIGSDVGGIGDIITHGDTGMLARQKDPADIAEKIITLLSSDELRNSLARKGNLYVYENFSWKRVGERFAEKIQNVLESR